MDASSLKAGTTQTLSVNPNSLKPGATSLRGGPTAAIRPGMRGQPTKMGGPGQKTKMNKSKMQTTSSQAGYEYVKEGEKYVTPKKLITKVMLEMWQEYTELEKVEQEKEKNEKLKRSASQNESQSIMQSADKSSNSDNKMSSSGIKDSSFQQSQRSENTESEDDSKGKSEQKDDKKTKKQKVLSEEEKNEQIIINLSETETQFLLFIPSSQVVPDVSQANSNKSNQQILERNQKYEKFQQERIGSDNYTSRAANTFNYAPKIKEQQSQRVEKNETGCYVANWDLYDAAQQEQLTEFEILAEDIKRNIERELKFKLRNPFCQLPTDVRAIKIHKDVEVPGSHLIFEQVKKKDNTKGVGGATSFAGTGAPHGSSSVHPQYQVNDDTNKESSEKVGDFSGTKIGRTMDGKSQPTKTYGAFKGESQEQLQKQAKLLQERLELEEKQMIREFMDDARKQPTEEEQLIMSSDNLMTNLKYVDRILNQNTYHKQYILYRNYPEVKITKMATDDDQKKKGIGQYRQYKDKNQDEEDEKDKKQEPLNYLFKFNCNLTENRTVSCADWNPINKDLLAVTYGESDLNINNEGLIMFWTLKNPSYPERIIKYPTRVTCCKFSQQNPNLLAAGTYDGVVAIYDLRKKDGIPVAENKELKGKHSDVIWEVNWVPKGGKTSDKGEGLVSISSDGRVVEWSMKKGLEYTNLMNLKKSSPPGAKENATEGINFRDVAGLSMDFLKGESSMYLVATDDGAVHRCSKSYQEQYLDSFYGHSGPVYRVRCNPFQPDIFLTCSADWSCKLWNIKALEQYNPICNFLSLDLFDEVMDIEWSPNTSTVFASVCKDGRLELWDVEKNSMDPYCSIVAKPGEFYPEKTMVRFGQESPIIITGDVAGDVNVYRLHGYEDQDQNVQTQKLEKVLLQAGYSKGKGDKQGEHE